MDSAARRALNLAVAAAGVVATAPLMLVIAFVIKITSRGPAIYTQPRVGIDRRAGRNGGNHRRTRDVGGRPFTIYKFRTMRASPVAAEAQVWASPDDPRVTAVGRFLRKYRLDELPQLFNVLRGDMNVVGPRPEQPRIFEKLRTEIDHYQHRQRVLPGITGWAQINHHYDSSVDDVKRKVAFDLEYIARCSAAEDCRIMLRTFPVIALKKGAW
jgi:lipopolysaccharide/colanic/teichoic acid biosynthesis glycosyltransferase